MDIVVKREHTMHLAEWGAGRRRCAVGRAGIADKLHEGDGITPVGRWPIRQVLYRADRLEAPRTEFPLRAIEPNDVWCDNPKDPNYNRLIQLAKLDGAEHLWREDHLYDVILVVGFNDAPIVPHKGSAIFVHVARQDYGPTEGCVALARGDLLEALAQMRPQDKLVVQL
jgi:L,D-peptidoglycan transpeptidase YkuD (ErfK/YbiS/YcfS/YnhG family)